MLIRPSILTVLIAGSVLLVAGPAARAQCDPSWDVAIGNPGADSTVWNLTAADGASDVGPALYVGGQFSSAGGITAENIAKWDGSAWSALGTGAENGGTVYAMVVSEDGLLYVGGEFGNMGGQSGTKRIAKWDGSAWSDVGGGMTQNNAGIRALAFFGDDLYAGGYLNEIGGITAHKIARWDGASWSALPGDPLTSTDVVESLAVYDDGSGEAIYIGGEFAIAGGVAGTSNIFRWDGVSLEPLGEGTNDVVEALAVWNGDLYVGGHFNRVYQSGGTELVANKIARWDGTSWSAVGDGMNAIASYHVWALAPFDDGNSDAIYAGGNFTTAGGLSVSRFARWDGSVWSAVGSANLNGYVYALAVWGYEGGLFLGGTFTTSGTPSSNKIVKWGPPRPHSPMNAEADPPSIIAGESSALTASVAGATIHWYTGGCGQTLVGTGDSILVSPTETTTYWARAFDGVCWSYACGVATVTVSCAPPTITTQPVGGTTCTGHSHELCVAAQGAGELNYQWRRNGLVLVGATSPCYTVTQAGTYWCVVADDCGPSESAAVTVAAASPDSGDFDGDQDADLDDHGLLESCLGGPTAGIAEGCECVDVDDDGHIGLLDFAVFQIVFGA